MLASHPKLYSVSETHILREGIGRGTGRLRAPFKRVGLLKRLALEQNSRVFRFTSGSSVRVMLRWKTLFDAMVDILDNAAVSAGRFGWIEKTPEHLFYIERIRKVLPDARFVHVVREGGAVTASIVEMWSQLTAEWPAWRHRLKQLKDFAYIIPGRRRARRQGNRPALRALMEAAPFIRAAELWNSSLLEAKRFQGREDHLVCSYEELTRDPEKVLRAVVQFTGIEFDSSMMDFHDKAAELVRGDEPWKEKNLQALQKSSTDKFDRLEKPVQNLIREVLLAGGDPWEVLRRS